VLAPLGPLVIEPVSVGILVKRSRTFVELRPRRDGVTLSFLLNRTVEHPRITRRIGASSGRTAHFVPLRRAGDVDALVAGGLVESYLDSVP
jgi:hypothetical protein